MRIVLVGTTHPGNIGATARAMKNMGLERLTLVAPKRFPHPDATARASGAADLLEGAERHATLAEALAESAIAIGASARVRGLALPELTPRACVALLRREAREADGRDAALVFGREHSGLTNEELALCQWQTRIPANPAFPSLNLAAAVQIFAYEWRLQSVTDAAPSSRQQGAEAEGGFAGGLIERRSAAPATSDEMEHLYAHLEEALLAAGFLNPANPRLLMRRLRLLFNRARPDRNEAAILRGALAAFQREMDAAQS